MGTQMMAWTADGGIPLFNRKLGEDKIVPFALMGTINGLNLFATAHNAKLISTTTENGEKITWKSYLDSILLILITTKADESETAIDRLLDNIFNCMVMVVGSEALAHITNVERLKRELKACYNTVDYLLFQKRTGSDFYTIGDLVGATDRLLSKENFQGYLEQFCAVAESGFGCLLCRGKVVVATKRWWALPAAELALLPVFVSALPRATARELLVYLPLSWPTMCNRLVTFQLTQDIELCALWGNTTPLASIEDEVPRCWKGAYDQLKLTSTLYPRNIPGSLQLDPNVLGVVLVNQQKHQCLYSLTPIEEGAKYADLPLPQRHLLIRSAFRQVQQDYLLYRSLYPRIQTPPVSEAPSLQPTEAYYLYDSHSIYFISEEVYYILVLLSSSVPRYALRKVAQSTLKTLTTYKHCPI